MKSTKPKPASVYLTVEEQERLSKIAEELGVTPHALRKFAIQRLLVDWARGWRPKRKKKTVQTLEP